MGGQGGGGSGVRLKLPPTCFQKNKPHQNKHQEINVKDSKDTKTTPYPTKGSNCWGKRHQKRYKKEKKGSHWSMMDPRVEMALFTASTFPAENSNTGETEACLENCSFSRVSFLVCT